MQHIDQFNAPSLIDSDAKTAAVALARSTLPAPHLQDAAAHQGVAPPALLHQPHGQAGLHQRQQPSHEVQGQVLSELSGREAGKQLSA